MPERNSEQWAVVDANFKKICEYSTIEGIDGNSDSDVPSEPIENGKLAAFNKVVKPRDVQVTLLFDGDYSNQSLALAKLESARAGTSTFIVITPSQVFKNMALRTFNYSRSQSGGVNLLAVECQFVEIISINQNKSKYVPRKATSANETKTGATQPHNSVAGEAFRGVRNAAEGK